MCWGFPAVLRPVRWSCCSLSASLWAVSTVAFCGALAVALILYGLSRRDFASYDGSSRLLLTGVILAFGCSAVVTLLLTVAPDHDLRGMVFWLVGDLSGATFNAGFVLVVVAVFIPVWRVSSAVNLLALHADMARSLGVNVPWLKKGLFAGGASDGDSRYRSRQYRFCRPDRAACLPDDGGRITVFFFRPLC